MYYRDRDEGVGCVNATYTSCHHSGQVKSTFFLASETGTAKIAKRVETGVDGLVAGGGGEGNEGGGGEAEGGREGRGSGGGSRRQRRRQSESSEGLTRGSEGQNLTERSSVLGQIVQ